MHKTPRQPALEPTLDTQRALPVHSPEVARLVDHGIAETPFAWHGTSVEAILYLAEHGELPSSGSYGTEFFYAPEALDPGMQDDHATMYAGWNATKIYVLERLPFTPQDSERFMYAVDPGSCGDLFDDFVSEEALPHNITRDQLLDWIYEANKSRRGVLLGISADIERDFRQEPPLDRDQRSIVIPGGGLPLRYITGIEPLGDYEWDTLVELQEQVAADPKTSN